MADAVLTIQLRDPAQDVVLAWQQAFSGVAGVDVSCGDIFEYTADAIVSPSNSFGFMDGGIDLDYARFFGPDLESGLRMRIAGHHCGELPVGQAIVLPTGHASIAFLISAPTMRVPGTIANTVNVYLAFRAALVAVLDYNRSSASPIQSLLVPGFGTGVGHMPPQRAARQMRMAYEAVVLGAGLAPRTALEVLADHHRLLF